MAWWTVKKGKKFARGWAIAASVEIILLALLLFIASRAMIHRTYQFEIVNGFLLALGITGILAFARRDAMADGPIDPVKPPRIKGDGTSGILDGMIWLLGVVGYIAALNLWHRWGNAQQLPRAYGGLAQLLVILLIITVLHELGHAIIGLAIGMKLRAFIIGPFQWRIRDGRWSFQFLLARAFSMGGATGLVPTDPRQSIASHICMIAAGPAVNLWTGLLALYLALMAKGQSYEPYWGFFAYFATLSLLVFVSNLLPMRSEAHYSDGARIYQLLSGGPWADLQRVLSVATSTTVTPLRPRDYDIDAIQRTELSFTEGHHALVLRLLASDYFMDHGMMRQAADATGEAERIFHASVFNLPAELCMAFVFRSAFLRHDAADARQWWERMEAKKPTHLGVDYWLAKSALAWIEGSKEEAQEAWAKGDALAQKLPAAGDYEFDRDRSKLLHECIEKEEVVAVG